MGSHLRLNSIGRAEEVGISDAEFDALVSARAILTAAFALEESYDLLIGNYVEVEQELLAATADSAVRNSSDYHDFFELRSTINRRVVNLLTATKLYLDQAPQRLALCAKEPEIARKEFEKNTNRHYEASSSYRFLEALRNHVQHRGLAVHSVSIKNRWIGEDEGRELEISIQPLAEKRYLIDDRKFKKSVLAEMPEKIVLTRAIRQYLQCIGELQKLVRGYVEEHADAARSTIQQQISTYGAVNGGNTLGLTAYKTNASGEQQTVSLMLDWDDVRKKLVTRNSTLGALGRYVATGRAS